VRSNGKSGRASGNTTWRFILVAHWCEHHYWISLPYIFSLVIFFSCISLAIQPSNGGTIGISANLQQLTGRGNIPRRFIYDFKFFSYSINENYDCI
jgi:hypothetical protein